MVLDVSAQADATRCYLLVHVIAAKVDDDQVHIIRYVLSHAPVCGMHNMKHTTRTHSRRREGRSDQECGEAWNARGKAHLEGSVRASFPQKSLANNNSLA